MFDWPAVEHHELQRGRGERIGAFLRSERLDHLLLTSFDNIRYATGYRTQIISEGFDWFAAVVRPDGDFEIFVPWVEETSIEPDPALPGLTAVHPLPSWTPAIPHAAYWSKMLRRARTTSATPAFPPGSMRALILRRSPSGRERASTCCCGSMPSASWAERN